MKFDCYMQSGGVIAAQLFNKTIPNMQYGNQIGYNPYESSLVRMSTLVGII